MTTAPETSAAQAETSAQTEAATSEKSTGAEEANQPALIDAAQQWLHALRVIIARAIDITVLEARLAALNFVLILIVGVASGLLLASAWIALFGAIVAVFHEMGLSWPLAFLLMAAINLLLAIIGGFMIYRMSNNMLFQAIRRFILYGAKEDGDSGSTAGDPPAAP